MIIKIMHVLLENYLYFDRDNSQSDAIFLESLHEKTFMRYFKKMSLRLFKDNIIMLLL
jgi:hypothetical protein